MKPPERPEREAEQGSKKERRRGGGERKGSLLEKKKRWGRKDQGGEGVRTAVIP